MSGITAALSADLARARRERRRAIGAPGTAPAYGCPFCGRAMVMDHWRVVSSVVPRITRVTGRWTCHQCDTRITLERTVP